MNESISALMDDELEDPFSNTVLKNLQLDGEMQQIWHEYHLISDVIRANSIPAIDVREQVSMKLHDEPIVFSPRPWFAVKGRQRWAAGVAVAASVTLAITVGWPLLNQQVGQPGVTQAVESQPAVMDKTVALSLQEMDSPYLQAHQDMSTDPNVVSVSLSGNGDN